MKCLFCEERVRAGEARCPSCGMALPRREPEGPPRSFEQLRQLSKRAFWKDFAPERLHQDVEGSLLTSPILALGIPAAGLTGHQAIPPLVFLALAAAAALFGLGTWRWMSRACAAGTALCTVGFFLLCQFWGGGVLRREWTLLIPGLYPLVAQGELHTAYCRFQRELARRQQKDRT